MASSATTYQEQPIKDMGDVIWRKVRTGAGDQWGYNIGTVQSDGTISWSLAPTGWEPSGPSAEIPSGVLEATRQSMAPQPVEVDGDWVDFAEANAEVLEYYGLGNNPSQILLDSSRKQQFEKVFGTDAFQSSGIYEGHQALVDEYQSGRKGPLWEKMVKGGILALGGLAIAELAFGAGGAAAGSEGGAATGGSSATGGSATTYPYTGVPAADSALTGVGLPASATPIGYAGAPGTYENALGEVVEVGGETVARNAIPGINVLDTVGNVAGDAARGAAREVVEGGNGSDWVQEVVDAAGGSVPGWLEPLLGGIGTLIGAERASDAASDATDAQLQASREALDFLRESRDIGLEQTEPFRQASLGAIANLYDLNGMERPEELAGYSEYGDFRASPSYQWRMDEGMRALEAGAAARGGLLSGGTIRGATRYAQNVASQEYDKIYNRIATIAGYGPSAAGEGAGTATNYGGNAANVALNAGDVRGHNAIAQNNVWQNAIDQLAQIDWGGIWNT